MQRPHSYSPKFRFDIPNGLAADDDGLLRMQNKIWIPMEADKHKVELLTVAHPGQAGHHGFNATAAMLRKQFSWKELSTDAKVFIANCFLCVLSCSGT